LFHVTVLSDHVAGAGVTLRVRPATPELTVKVSVAVVTAQREGVAGRAKLTRVRWFDVPEVTDRVVKVPVLTVGDAWETVLSALAFTVVVPGAVQKVEAAAKAEEGLLAAAL
jgi:hypothetical protein